MVSSFVCDLTVARNAQKAGLVPVFLSGYCGGGSLFDMTVDLCFREAGYWTVVVDP